MKTYYMQSCCSHKAAPSTSHLLLVRAATDNPQHGHSIHATSIMVTERTAELTEEEVQSEQDALLMVAVEIIGEMLLTVADLEVCVWRRHPHTMSAMRIACVPSCCCLVYPCVPTHVQAGLRALPGGFGAVFPSGQAGDNESSVQARVGDVITQLQQRAQEEIAMLPFPSVAAAAVAVETRNQRVRGIATDPMASTDGSSDPGATSSLRSTLDAAEKAAEKFVAQRLQPAVAKVRSSTPRDWVGNAKAAATYARGLWDRLNGGKAGEVAIRPPDGLPLPASTKVRF